MAISATQRLLNNRCQRDVAKALEGLSHDELTDNNAGTASTTLAIGASYVYLPINLTLAAMTTGAADLITTFTPGFRGKIVSYSFVTTVLGTGTSASQVLNWEVGTTNMTGGVLTLLLADTDTLGKTTAATAFSAGNTFTAAESISLEVAVSGTVFTAGAGTLLVKLQNLDLADAIASLAAQNNYPTTARV